MITQHRYVRGTSFVHGIHEISRAVTSAPLSAMHNSLQGMSASSPFLALVTVEISMLRDGKEERCKHVLVSRRLISLLVFLFGAISHRHCGVDPILHCPV